MKINFREPFFAAAGDAAAGGDTGAGSTVGKAGAASGSAAAGSTTVVGDAAATGETKPGTAGKEGTAGKDGQQAADANKGGKAGEQTTPKAPEKYALKLPDGGRLDESDLAEVEKVARANDWTNEEAQAAIEEHDKLVLAQSDRFLATTKADADYGGDKLGESQKLARAVIDKVRPAGHARRESFLKFVNRGGAGNHIEVVAFLADLGKLMAEDGATGGEGGNKKDGGDVASKLYDAK